MLKFKTFYKKTRSGQILKVVREHYLRDDLHCGYKDCAQCQDTSDAVPSAVLSSEPEGKSSLEELANTKHYLLLDTNVVLNEIDILEHKEGGLHDVIIVQTVLEEVRHRSAPIYKRLRDILSNADCRFYVFINEHHQDTYVERQPGETANDRNDRAIRTAAAWYNRHLNKVGIRTVLISDDAANRSLAREMGVPTASMSDYVAHYGDEDSRALFLDKLSSREGRVFIKDGPDKLLFPPHLTQKAMNSGIKSGSLIQGTFYASQTNFQEGTVHSDSYSKPILIQGLGSMNRAFNGDVVAVRLLEETKWTAKMELMVEDEGFDVEDTLETANQLLANAPLSKEIEPTGVVVGIVRRKWRQYCGILQQHPDKQSIRHLFVPTDRRAPKIRIETRQADRLFGQRIIVAVDTWPLHSRYPCGHFVRALGPVGDKSTENQVLLLEHDIPHSSFGKSVLDCLPAVPWSISDEQLQSRQDFRNLTICSVDPPGCTDIDDALHCRRLEDGRFEVGVHIADVSHFVRPGTALDSEAANRATTVYLTDRRISMLPELLTADLCSLRCNVDRYAFSCILQLDQQGSVTGADFRKSVIRSEASMTYEQAQNMIDDSRNTSAVADSLRNLMMLSKMLKQRRMEAGALVLASSEVRFTIDSETADPIDVEAKKVFETNSMVEEFMLAANIAAAERILSEFPECALLRCHPVPPAANFEPLLKAGRLQGFDIQVGSNKALADSLDKAVDKKNVYLNTMLRMIATRCMMQAVYFSSGSQPRDKFGHYGLAVPIYTHFTSPIRRYADLIVHRLLAAAIGADATYRELLDNRWINNLANRINFRHRMAQYASRASVNQLTHVLLRKESRHDDGYIIAVRQNAIQVLVPRYGIEGTLFMRTADKHDQVVFKFDPDKPSQECVQPGGVTLTLFQKIVVELSLDSSQMQHEKLQLRLVWPYIEGFSVPDVQLPATRKRRSEDVAVMGGAKLPKPGGQ